MPQGPADELEQGVVVPTVAVEPVDQVRVEPRTAQGAGSPGPGVFDQQPAASRGRGGDERVLALAGGPRAPELTTVLAWVLLP